MNHNFRTLTRPGWTGAGALLVALCVAGIACESLDSAEVAHLGASLNTAVNAPARRGQSSSSKHKKVDMSYVFSGSRDELAKINRLSFKKDMSKREKTAAVKNISAVLRRMQRDGARDSSITLPKSVKDGAAVWNALSVAEQIKLLEPQSQYENFGSDKMNWAAAAVGIAAAGLAYQFAKDEKWINDKDLLDMQTQKFSEQALDHMAAMGKSPLMLSAKH